MSSTDMEVAQLRRSKRLPWASSRRKIYHGLGRKIDMSSGVIRRLVPDRGFGFIGNSGSKFVFFHYSQLQGSDFRSLKEGQSVSYRIGLGIKGFEAVDIKASGAHMHGAAGA